MMIYEMFKGVHLDDDWRCDMKSDRISLVAVWLPENMSLFQFSKGLSQRGHGEEYQPENRGASK